MLNKKTVEIKQVVLVKPSSMTKENAYELSKKLRVPVIYVEDLNGVSSHEIEEIENLIKKTKEKHENPKD